MNNMTTSEYVENESRTFSLYTIMSRAIPFITDGLKPAHRRALWVARNGEKYKTATLAGLCMPLHPHQMPDEAINTITAPYGNNIPFFKGYGAFGTLLTPTAYGASRYTSVTTSDFTEDVLYADIDIIPMQENYDGTLMEPKYFLPLVPTVLLNPISGIAVGFACDILPRELGDIIEQQINYLSGKAIVEPPPSFTPSQSRAFSKNDKDEWVFGGTFQRIDKQTVRITNLPYGVSHERYINKLYGILEKNDEIQDIEDNSQKKYCIDVKFKRGALQELSDEELYKKLALIATATENLNVLDFECSSVWNASFSQIIEKFSDWRLTWYLKRYEELAKKISIDIQKHQDVLTAIKNNIGALARKVSDRVELKDIISELGIVNVDYIADLPVYRFTENESKKVEEKLEEALKTLKEYNTLINDNNLRKEKYIVELKQILANYKKGKYTTKE